MKKYSVVIPAYNCSLTICESLDSILNQTRYDLIDEIIIVNDGSTDNTQDVVNEYILIHNNDNIRLINKINGGAASARNIGIINSRNQYIALLDADDIWLPKKIELQDSIISQYDFIRALGTNREGEIISIGKKVANGVRKVSPVMYCIKNWPCTPSIIFDKTIFQDQAPFPEDMTHAEEGLFFLKLSYTCGLYYMQESLVYCGGGKRAYGSRGLSGNIYKMHKGVEKMLCKAVINKYISWAWFPFLYVYEMIKYLRRKCVVFLEVKQ